MNTPESREGNLIRYIIYILCYVLAAGVVELVTKNSPLHVWDLILFASVAAMVLLFYIYRFNREQRYFQRLFYVPWLGDFGLTVGLTLGITATRIIVLYLQAYNHISWYNFQISYLAHPSNRMFWFVLLSQGLVLPILQEFLATGFLFNYHFRKNTVQTALTGIFVSGLIFTFLNFQTSLPLMLIDCLYGMIFAWSYLYTQSLWMPLYLAVVNGILMVIMA